MKNKDLLYEIKEDLEKEMNSISLDFVSDYDIENTSYLCDAFTEYADSQISVYYCDQFKYYDDNPTECENALLNLYDGESIANIVKNEGLYNLCCHAGVCGQYERNTSELYEDEENIKKLLVVRYLIKNDIFAFNRKELEVLLRDAGWLDVNELTDLRDLVNDYLENKENK